MPVHSGIFSGPGCGVNSASFFAQGTPCRFSFHFQCVNAVVWSPCEVTCGTFVRVLMCISETLLSSFMLLQVVAKHLILNSKYFLRSGAYPSFSLLCHLFCISNHFLLIKSWYWKIGMKCWMRSLRVKYRLWMELVLSSSLSDHGWNPSHCIYCD